MRAAKHNYMLGSVYHNGEHNSVPNKLSDICDTIDRL